MKETFLTYSVLIKKKCNSVKNRVTYDNLKIVKRKKKTHIFELLQNK